MNLVRWDPFRELEGLRTRLSDESLFGGWSPDRPVAEGGHCQSEGHRRESGLTSQARLPKRWRSNGRAAASTRIRASTMRQP